MIHPEGAIRLIAAVLRQNTQAFVYYESLAYNEYRFFPHAGVHGADNGRELTMKERETFRKNAERDIEWLKSKHGAFYLMGMPADAFIRECKRVAKVTVDEAYRLLANRMLDLMKHKHVTREEVAEYLNITDTKLTRWLNRLYNDRAELIREAIYKIKEQKKQQQAAPKRRGRPPKENKEV